MSLRRPAGDSARRPAEPSLVDADTDVEEQHADG